MLNFDNIANAKRPRRKNTGNGNEPKRKRYEEGKRIGLESIASVCTYLNKKIRKLARMGKVSLSKTPDKSSNGGYPQTPDKSKQNTRAPAVEQNILDLKEGSFSGGCSAGTIILQKKIIFMYVLHMQVDYNIYY